MGWVRRRWLPLRTVRLRLTMLYGALFLSSGAALLAITYVLVWRATKPHLPSAAVVRQRGPELQAKVALEVHQHHALMHRLLVSWAIALAVAAVLSVVLGWLVAGRVLRPLRTMTATTQHITEQNLHRRLAVTGPDDELKALGDTIDDLLDRLEGVFDTQRRFVANASHELRTPLTMMRTALDVTTNKREPPAAGVTVLADKIRLGLDRADRLVESFLTLARAEHGNVHHVGIVSLDRLAAAAVVEHDAALRERGITVHQEHREASVRGSQVLLTHLMDNLIDNAVRHNQPGGWIHVVTDADPATNAARLVVENSGDVLDDRQAADLVQPFRRVSPDRSSADDKGVGLGLSIVAAIVATHDGILDLHARADGGLRVTVTVPMAPVAGPASAGVPP